MPPRRRQAKPKRAKSMWIERNPADRRQKDSWVENPRWGEHDETGLHNDYTSKPVLHEGTYRSPDGQALKNRRSGMSRRIADIMKKQ